MIPVRARGPLLVALAFVATALAGCEWDVRDPRFAENEPPSIRITGGAVEGGLTSYLAEFFWFGSDPDGFVDHFEYAIDDTCLCRYDVEVPVYLPDQDTTVVVTETIQSTHPDSCLAHGVEPAYESARDIWKRTEGVSGTFAFDATTPAGGDPPRATDWHEFFIRAVDDRGGRSPVASRLFNAETIAPTVKLITPKGEGFENAKQVSPFVTFRWQGRDEDSERPSRKPVGYQLKLVPLEHIFEPEDQVIRYITSPFAARRNLMIPETLVVAEGEEAGDETFVETDWWPKVASPYPHELLQMQNIVPGNYAFAVRSVDQAGAVMPDHLQALATEGKDGSAVKLDVNPGVPVRPIITIRELHLLGERLFVGDGEVWRVEVPTNTPLRFEWTLDTSHYGARPAGSNYGIDLPDPGCDVCQSPDGVGGWIGWGNRPGIISDIIFSDDQAGETHVLYVRARDESFREERQALALVVMDVIGFPFDQPALWVDDYQASGINDCTHDAFVRSLLEPAIEPYLPAGDELHVYDSRESVNQCGESSSPRPPKLSRLSRYRALFWNAAASGHGTALGRLTDPSPTSTLGKYLSIYVRAGGHLVVWGRYTAGAMLGDLYSQNAPYIPEIPAFPDGNYGPGSFLWDVLRVRNLIDGVVRAPGQQLSTRCSGIVGMEASARALEEGFPGGVPDPSGYDPERVALWFDAWEGERNAFGSIGANGFVSPPALREFGMDTLYTYVSNSWSYAAGGPSSIRDACGTAFLSAFERNPVALRYRDPEARQGNVFWFATPLHIFAGSHQEDLALVMKRIADSLFMVN